MIALQCVVQLLVSHGLALRHEGLLVFPSEFPAMAEDDGTALRKSVSLYYDISGAIDNIYASLVVNLALSGTFGRVRLANNRAEYDQVDELCGMRRIDHSGGLSRLDLYFGESTREETRFLFTAQIEAHLRAKGVRIMEVLSVTCECGYVVDQELVRQRINAGREDVLCGNCETRLPINLGASNARTRLADIAEVRLDVADSGYLQRAARADRKDELGSSVKRVTMRPVLRQVDVDASAQQEPIRVLHLSDLHLSADVDPVPLWRPLLADIQDRETGLGFQTVDYLVISGDLTNRADEREFECAHKFLSLLIQELRLSAQRCIIVPGNHDLSWEVEDAYKYKKKRLTHASELRAGAFVQQTDGYLIRDDERYARRFENFGRFYHQLLQEAYPLDVSVQSRAYTFEDSQLQFLALNSAWEIDEYFTDRSSIHASALSASLQAADKFARQSAPRKPLRIAVWHHPITGNEKMKSDAFLEQLRPAGVKLCLHGHVHENKTELVSYLDPQRKLHVIGAGSFGAPAKDRPESTPRLYNLLEIERDHSRVRVHTRCLRKDGGAWDGWAVWRGDKPHERRTYYDVQL